MALCPCLAFQYITKTLAKLVAHDLVQTCLILAYTLSQMNPLHANTFDLLRWQLTTYLVNLQYILKATNTRRIMHVPLANIHHSFMYRPNP